MPRALRVWLVAGLANGQSGEAIVTTIAAVSPSSRQRPIVAARLAAFGRHLGRLDAVRAHAYGPARSGFPPSERVLSREAISTDTLLMRVGTGDRVAFRELYAAVSSRLFAICVALLRDRARAEDALQESFVRVWEQAKTFDPEKGAALAWLTVVTRRIALSELRRRDGRHQSFDDDAADLPELVADLPEQDPIGKARLEDCLGRLDPDRRRYVLLAYLHGYTHEELAHRFDRPLGTMKSFLFRGLADLRKCIS
jgi:RNA polymerase sigma-70 factor (ECF subfamily)